MIRFVVGLFMILGAVGADDYALEAGTAAPPLSQTIVLCAIGLSLMWWYIVQPKVFKK
jgi:hypothetical protein